MQQISKRGQPVWQQITQWLATSELGDAVVRAAALFSIGFALEVAKVMQAPEPIVWRVAVGRSVVTAFIAMAGGSVLLLIPSAPFLGVIGLAAGLASLGTAALERWLFERVRGGL